MIIVFVDNSCINSKQEILPLNKLEELHNKKIFLQKTDTFDTEIQGRWNSTIVSKKSSMYNEARGPFVLGHSRLGHSVLGNQDDAQRIDRILVILFGEKNRNEYGQNEIRDAMHLATSIRYGGDFFITLDNDFLSKSKEIEYEFGISIRQPAQAYTEIIRKINK